MVLGQEHTEYMKKLNYHKLLCEEQYRSRTRPTTPVIPHNSLHQLDHNTSLANSSYELEDRWWLSSSCKSFLETREKTFGRKNVFLISKKDSPISNPELRKPVGSSSGKPGQKSNVRQQKTVDEVDATLKGIVDLSLAECKTRLTKLENDIQKNMKINT